ncbi:helix-turn-helix transcriptional regulator [Nocardioides panacihumi]|uniref:response regulator transcription factor n=1 Tax=Nocardioides panacihumi TaxID=400774 RepID=UPI0031E11509
MNSVGLSTEADNPRDEPDREHPLRAWLPHDEERVRGHVVAALNAMIDEVAENDLDLTATENGVALMLEHDNVRCVLVVSPPMRRHSLSPREMQIARLVASGATNRAIASSLDISLWTVSTHMRRIFSKLGVCSRAEMVAQFYGGGDVPPEATDRGATSELWR